MRLCDLKCENQISSYERTRSNCEKSLYKWSGVTCKSIIPNMRVAKSCENYYKIFYLELPTFTLGLNFYYGVGMLINTCRRDHLEDVPLI